MRHLPTLLRKRLAYIAIAIFAWGRPEAAQFPSLPDQVPSGIQVEALKGGALGLAPENAPPVSKATLALIKDFERWMPYAYDDASDFCTIGYGHLVALSPCADNGILLAKFHQPLSTEDGLSLLKRDVGLASSSVLALVHVQLNDEQFGALTSFVFNVGKEKFAKSTMLGYLNEGNFYGAANEFPKWIRSKRKVLDGLITRRSCEATLFRGELAFSEKTGFHRSNCSSLGAAPSASDLIDVD